MAWKIVFLWHIFVTISIELSLKESFFITFFFYGVPHLMIVGHEHLAPVLKVIKNSYFWCYL